QPGQSCTDVGVSALSRAPVDPVPVIGTAVALDLHMPGHGHLAVGQQVHGIGVGGRGGKGETGAYAMPVPPDGPGGGFPRVSPAWAVYLDLAAKSRRLTPRLSQEQKGLDERARMASQ